MTLNKRATLLILPLLSLCCLLMFWGGYQSRTAVLFNTHLDQARLAASHVLLGVERYSNFGEGFFSSLLQSKVLRTGLKSTDKRYQLMTIEPSISAIIQQFPAIPFPELTLLVLDAQGEPLFYFQDNEDPFAEPGRDFQARALAAKDTLEDRRTFIAAPDGYRLQFIRRVNLETMRPPLYADDPDAVVIALLFDMPDLSEELQQLALVQGYGTQLLPALLRFEQLQEASVSEELEGLLQLVLTLNRDALAAARYKLAWQMLVALVGFLLAINLMILGLIRRYITGPISCLQFSISEAIHHHRELPDYSEGSDEVSLLGRDFCELYGELQASYQATKTVAETDNLTQLNNRNTFGQFLERMIERAQYAQTHLALLYIDLDNFKFVNDRYGHEAGDLLLREFSAALSAALRVTDTLMSRDSQLARLGGDEFGVLLPEVARDEDVRLVCERILRLFDDGFETSEGRFPVSASIGVALYPRDGASPLELTCNADAAMYQAKEAGRDQYSFYSSELAERARRERTIADELQKHPFDEFTLFYMPIIKATDGSVKSVEALLRWTSPSLGFISPAEFIPIAESKGVFEKLDLWVVNRALDDTPRLLEIFGEQLIVSVNISSAQLNSGEFFLNLMSCFARREIDKRSIQLEITETFAAGMSARVEANLALLKQAGFSLALDDFGTGYTSLAQMVDYPLDVIKIDKSLVDRMDEARGRDMVLSLVGFCKQQGFSVTAEGVETAEQAQLLTAAGIDSLQGFYFAKPQPLEAFAAE